MKRTLMITISAVLLLPLGLVAQEDGADEAPQPLSDVWMVVPKAGMGAEFAAAAAAEITAQAEAGSSRSWQAYRPVVGHNLNVVQYRHCCFDWADVDVLEAEDAELGLDESWGKNVGPFVEHYHHYYERSDWENSYWPDEGTSGPYYGVTSWSIKQGAGPAGGQAKEKMSQLALNEGWSDKDVNWLWLSRIGGKPVTALVSSYENYADMAPPEQSFFEFASEKLGAEEAGAMFGDFANGFTDSNYTIWVYDESLSSPSADE